MRISRYIAAGISATAMLGFYGCSGNIDSGVPSTASSTAEQVVNALGFVGSAKCIECHETRNPALVSDYLEGIHVVHGTGVTAASGEACLQCHDPIGDGRLIQDRIPAANVPAEGLAAVGCEGCHGNQSGHYRVVSPGAETCGQCHDANHITDNPEGNNIYSDYLAGNKHSKAPTHLGAPCVKCHTDEGGRMYKDIHTVEGLETVLALDAASPIQCRTCHNAHNPDKLLSAATATESAQYNTCTNCHQRHDAQVGVAVTPLPGSTSTDGSSGDLIYHAGRWTRVISSTHYDDPATGYGKASNVIEGYNLNPKSDRVCLDCHNVHSADITINEQWARSGHGGKILEAKEAAAEAAKLAGFDRKIEQVIAVRAAGALAADNAFAFYDWDKTTKLSGVTVVDDRGSCQMCHTATGNKNFLTNQAGYDPLNNDFSHLAGWSKDVSGLVTSSGQNELLYCWSCHTDNSGTMRAPGAITLAYTVDGLKPTLPDQGNSNVCINCHSGRGNMDSLVAPADVNPAGAALAVSASNVTKTHYLAAGATIFQATTKVGYMYPAANYADKSYFKHNTLGCAECHMSSNNSHSYAVVEKDGSGVITAITSTRCVKCHTGKNALFVGGSLLGQVADIWDGSAAVPTTVTQAMVDAAVAELEHEAHGYHDALAALAGALTSAGTPPLAGYPYFSGTATDQGHSGAIHNYSYLHHEPGAYAHNRYYAKRLIFDSIDWLTSGPAGSRSLDGSITLAAGTYGAAIEWLGGDVNTGIIATRP